jgi:hypothetical protein
MRIKKQVARGSKGKQTHIAQGSAIRAIRVGPNRKDAKNKIG